MDIQKECKIHGLTTFAERKENGSSRYRCRKCAVDAVLKRRRKVKSQAIEYKGGSCVKCGYNKSNNALQFHHLDPTTKEFGIAEHGHCKSWERVKVELDKCILLCANCHAETHEELNDK